MPCFLNLGIWKYYGFFAKIREHDGRVLRPFSTFVDLGSLNEEEIQALREEFDHNYSTAQLGILIYVRVCVCHVLVNLHDCNKRL